MIIKALGHRNVCPMHGERLSLRLKNKQKQKQKQKTKKHKPVLKRILQIGCFCQLGLLKVNIEKCEMWGWRVQ